MVRFARRGLGSLDDETNECAESSDKQEGHPEFGCSYLRLEFGEDAELSLLLAFFELGQSLVNIAAKIVVGGLDLFAKLLTDAVDLSAKLLADSREIGSDSGNVVFGGQIFRRSEEDIQKCACVVLGPVELVN